MQPLGKYFIELVKLFINPIIVVTIVSGICGMDNLKRVGRIGGKAILYFEVVTTIALLIGVVVAYLLQPGAGIATRVLTPHRLHLFKKVEEYRCFHFLEKILLYNFCYYLFFLGFS